MTDNHSRAADRLDLRVLDVPPPSARSEILIARVMSGITAVPQRVDDLARLLQWRGRLVAAAAVLAGVAALTVLALPRRPSQQPVEPTRSWVEAGHTPTNGELLALFQGYAP